MRLFTSLLGITIAGLGAATLFAAEPSTNTIHTQSVLDRPAASLPFGLGSTMNELLAGQPQPFTVADLENLVYVDGHFYDITVDDSVSTEVISHSQIRKIGYGHEKQVTVATTPSGTYSTDALFNPHVLYPGIHVRNADGDIQAIMSHIWRSGTGWVLVPVHVAGSILNIGQPAETES
ncbi:MAG: hypothetical protein KDJ19_02175 [Hyphomicrobiaceae bacterium]|nr:hypothetical protein [Hyphomicrobiaceae bacterium]MCC0023082.1 hypothetical protein [Hyphomicrobiaceae bacterium]